MWHRCVIEQTEAETSPDWNWMKDLDGVYIVDIFKGRVANKKSVHCLYEVAICIPCKHCPLSHAWGALSTSVELEDVSAVC